MGAVLVLPLQRHRNRVVLFVAASGLAAVILLSVGYAGFRVAVGRFGALPYRDADDDGAVSQSPGADGSASTDTLQAPISHAPSRSEDSSSLSVRRHPGTLGPRLGPVLPRRLQHGPALPRVPRGHFSFSRSAWSTSASRAGWVSTSCGGGSTGSNSAATSVGSRRYHARACRHPWRDLFFSPRPSPNCTCGERPVPFPDCDGGSSERLRSEPAARVVLPGSRSPPSRERRCSADSFRGSLQERYGRIVAIGTGGYLHPCTPRVLPGLRVAAAPRRVPRRYRHWMALGADRRGTPLRRHRSRVRMR